VGGAGFQQHVKDKFMSVCKKANKEGPWNFRWSS